MKRIWNTIKRWLGFTPVSTTRDQKPPRDDYEFADWKHAHYQEVDRILAKIQNKGFDALTNEEKATLKKKV